MTKCGVEISVQNVNAQGQLDEHIGEYLCDGFKDDAGHDMTVYSKVPCPDLEYLTCQNCRRLFSNLAELKQHQATCDSEGDFKCKYCGCTNNSEQQKVMHEAACPERTDDDEDFDSVRDDFLNILSTGNNALSIGRDASGYVKQAVDALKELEIPASKASSMLKQLKNLTESSGLASLGISIFTTSYDGYEGYLQDMSQGRTDRYNMIRNLATDMGGIIGGTIGGYLGANWGASLGAVGGVASGLGYGAPVTSPVGAAIGSVVGAVLFGTALSNYGEAIAAEIVDQIYHSYR